MPDKKDRILDEIRRVANLLRKDSISIREFTQNSRVSESTVSNTFGSWNRAIDAAGLKPNLPGVSEAMKRTKISEDELLAEINRLTDELGKPPSAGEMNAFGRFSDDPYRRTWGSFAKARAIAMALRGIGTAPPQANDQGRSNTTQHSTTAREVFSHSPRPIQSKERARFGAPIDFRGVRHAPLNEQGVVYLFGMVSRELGFLIESVRSAYPDCEGKRCVDSKKGHWEQVLIEFEYRSSNFNEPGHSINGCDIFVCWEHDWHDCPLEVLELKSAIRQLPNK